MIGRNGERGSGISALAAGYHDDDDDIYIYIYIYIYIQQHIVIYVGRSIIPLYINEKVTSISCIKYLSSS